MGKVPARTQGANQSWLSVRARTESSSSSRSTFLSTYTSLGLRHAPPRAASLFHVIGVSPHSVSSMTPISMMEKQVLGFKIN